MSLGSSFLHRNIILPKKPLSNRREPCFIPNTNFTLNFWVQIENGGEMVHMKKNGAPTIDSQSIASQLFAFSLFPYIGFLYFITKSKSAPKLTLFRFYFLLAFVGATIPAEIYAKVHYGTSLSNVDWLHGGSESLLTLTNLFIVLGLREAIRKATDKNDKKLSNIDTSLEENEKSSL